MKSLRSAFIAVVHLFLLSAAARAVDFEWDGGGGADNRWSNAANWNQIVPPGALDRIILTGASTNGPTTIDVDGSQEIHLIEHNGANGDYTFGETIGADTIKIFQGGPAHVLYNQTQGSNLTLNSNIELNPSSGSLLRFTSTNGADNSGQIIVNGNVSPSATATGTITLVLTSSNKSAGPWVTVNGDISDDPNATIGLIAGLETGFPVVDMEDHSGEVSVTGLSTFTGPVRITGGKLIFNSIQNAGSSIANALGTPALADSTIVMGDANVMTATLRYVGTSLASNTSDRAIEIVGDNSAATIDASGTVPWVLSGGISASTSSATMRTLILTGSNTGDNTISGTIQPAAGDGVLNINKNGLGRWILSGDNSQFDGAIAVNAGELVVTNSIGTSSVSFPAGPLTIGSTGTFTLDGGSVTAGSFDNSADGTFNFYDGTLTVSGGTFAPDSGTVSDDFVIDGPTAAELPRLVLEDGATANVGVTQRNLYIGSSQQGELTVAGGATFSSGGSSFIGAESGSVGTVNIEEAGSTWNNPGYSVAVGNFGNGSLSIDDGASVTNKHGFIGASTGGTGAVTVSGVGSTWTNGGILSVGYGGNGTLSVTGGGTVTSGLSPFDEYSVIGVSANSTGIATIDGAGSSWTVTGYLSVGSSGDGTLNVTGGATVSNTNGYVGYNSGSIGVVTVEGADPNGNPSTWDNSNNSYVGGSDLDAGGTGTLNVNAGGEVLISNQLKIWNPGTVNLQGGALVVDTVDNTDGGAFNWTSGTFHMTAAAGLVVDPSGGVNAPLGDMHVIGANSQLLVDNNLTVGDSGAGTLDVTDGGAVSNVDGFVGFEPISFATGIVTVDGTDPNGVPSTWTNSGDLHVGVGSTCNGTLNITGGGAVSSSQGLIGENGNSTGTVNVDGAGSTWTNDTLLAVGNFGHGSLNITDGGAVSATTSYIAANGTSTGAATVDGPGSAWMSTGALVVGYYSSGTLNVTSGGAVSSNTGSIAEGPGTISTVTVDGTDPNGNPSTWINAGDLTVGNEGIGTLIITDGGAVSNDLAIVGYVAGGKGIAFIDGAGSTWTSSYELDVFRGSMSVTNGGHVFAAYRSYIAPYADMFATVTIDGIGSTYSVPGLDLGSVGGTGILNVQNGGTVQITNQLRVYSTSQLNLAGGTINANEVQVYGALSGFGTINASFLGGPSVDVFGGLLSVGDPNITQGVELTGVTTIADSATLELSSADVTKLGPTTTLSGGALVARNGIHLGLGDIVSGYGIFIGSVSGPGSFHPASTPTGTVDFYGDLDVGADTAAIYSQGQPTINGTLTFAGGNITTPIGRLHVGPSGAIQGAADLSGTTVQAELGSTIRAEGALTVGNGAVVNGFYSNGKLEAAGGAMLTLVDANEAVLDSAAWVALGDGGSPGTLVAAGGLTLDFGSNVTGHGTIDTPNNPATPLINNGHISGDDPNAPVTLTGYVEGVGTLDNVVITGTDAPGFSPATVNRGSVAYDGTLEIEIGGTNSGSDYDQLNHLLGDGIADLGGTLDVQLIEGFTPTAGDTFEIITAMSVLETFDNELLPTLGGGLTWLVDYQSTSVLLSVGLAGDFNFDGRVDGGDFLAWQRDTSLGNLTDWETNYGSTVTANMAAVPEPSAIMLALVGLAFTSRRRIA